MTESDKYEVLEKIGMYYLGLRAMHPHTGAARDVAQKLTFLLRQAMAPLELSEK